MTLTVYERKILAKMITTDPKDELEKSCGLTIEELKRVAEGAEIGFDAWDQITDAIDIWENC
jgi:hypothetical protein